MSSIPEPVFTDFSGEGATASLFEGGMMSGMPSEGGMGFPLSPAPRMAFIISLISGMLMEPPCPAEKAFHSSRLMVPSRLVSMMSKALRLRFGLAAESSSQVSFLW